MGVIKHFSSGDWCTTKVIPAESKLPNPDPYNFRVISLVQIKGYPILHINYPDCTNYEGNKIIVFDKTLNTKRFNNIERIDPHFINGKDSPIARFEPTERGMKMAISFVTNYNEEHER